MEKWKDVDGFQGFYQVSNMGRVRSLDRFVKHSKITNRLIKGKTFTPKPDSHGYYTIQLCKNKVCKSLKVHRLVAIAFIDNPENKPEVNHVRGNKMDNRSTELEWSTSSENQLHAFRTGLQIPLSGEKCYQSKLSDQQVLEIKKLLQTKSGSEISRMFNVSRGTICDIKMGRTRKTIYANSF